MLLLALLLQYLSPSISYSTGLKDPGPTYYGVPRSYCYFYTVGHPPVDTNFAPQNVTTHVELVAPNGSMVLCYQPETSYMVKIFADNYKINGLLLTSKRKGGKNDNVSDVLGTFVLPSTSDHYQYSPCENSVTQKKALNLNNLVIPWIAPSSNYPVTFVYTLVFKYKKYLQPRVTDVHSCESPCVLSILDVSSYNGTTSVCQYSGESIVYNCVLQYPNDAGYGVQCLQDDFEYVDITLQCSDEEDNSWTITANMTSALTCKH